MAPLKRIIAGRGNCGTLLGTGLLAPANPPALPPGNFEPLQSTRFSRRASLDKMSLPPLSRLRTTASIFSLTADNRNDDITCPIPRVSPVSASSRDYPLSSYRFSLFLARGPLSRNPPICPHPSFHPRNLSHAWMCMYVLGRRIAKKKTN